MNIAELFVSLGFKIEGADKLAGVDRELGKTTFNAQKAALAVGALAASFLRMNQAAMKAAVALRNYASATGFSTNAIQEWQRVAAGVNVSASSIANTFKNLQDVASGIKLGEGGASGYAQMLGISQTDDPDKVLLKLREMLKTIKDVGIARRIADNLGVNEEAFRILRLPDEEFERFRNGFKISPEAIKSLTQLSSAWELLKRDAATVSTQFFAALAPVLQTVVEALNAMLKPLKWFTDWLNSGKMEKFTDWLNPLKLTALALKTALGGVFVVVVALAGAFTALAFAVMLFNTAVGLAGALGMKGLLTGAAAWVGKLKGLVPLINGWLAALGRGLFLIIRLLPVIGAGVLALVGPALAVAAPFLAIAAIIAGILLLVEDIYQAFTGGDAVTIAAGRWFAALKPVEAILDRIGGLWNKITNAGTRVKDFFIRTKETLKANEGPGASSNVLKDFFEGLNSLTSPYTPSVIPASAQPANTNVQNSVNVQVNGAKEPKATGREVANITMKSLADAYNMGGLSGY